MGGFVGMMLCLPRGTRDRSVETERPLPTVGARYRHVETDEVYTVVCLATVLRTQEQVVVVRDERDRCYGRSEYEFISRFSPRFVPVDESL